MNENREDKIISKINLKDCIEAYKVLYIHKILSFDDIIKISNIGEISKYNLRGLVWKIYLEILPYPNIDHSIIDEINNMRSEYNNKVDIFQQKRKYSSNPLDNKNVY